MRKLWLLVCLAFIFPSAGPNPGGTFADDAGAGSVAWTNVSNVSASDDSYATLTLQTLESSHYLKVTNFGFSIPSTATVDGIQLEVESKADVAASVEDWANAYKGGGHVSGSEALVTPQLLADETEQYRTAGGPTSLWNTTWAYTDINDVGFGFGYQCNETGEVGPTLISTDHVRVTVYYTEASTGRTHKVIGYGRNITITTETTK